MPFYLQRNGIKVIHWFNMIYDDLCIVLMLHGPMVLDPASALEAKQWDSHLHAQGAAKMPCHIQVLWTTLERIKSTEGLEENPQPVNPMKIIKDYQHLTEAVNEQIACFWDASGCLWVESSNVQRLLSPAQGQLLSSPTFSHCRMIFRHFARFCTVRSSTSDFRD